MIATRPLSLIPAPPLAPVCCDARDAFYIHVKADRDLTLGLALLALLLYRRALPLALLVAAGTVAPVFDCALSLADPRGHVGYALAVHGSAVLYGLVTLWVLLRPAARPA